MRSTQIVKWLRAFALSTLLLVPQSGPGIAAWSAAGIGTAVVSTPSQAWARSSSSTSSSGGYSKSSSSRTPSTSSSSSSSSSSGGYTKSRTPSTSSYSSSSQSASDKAISRQGSSDALARYRSNADAQPSAAASTSSSGKTGSSTSSGNRDGGWSSWGSGDRRPSSSPNYAPSGGGSWAGWYGQRGWSPSSYMQSGSRFGMWDGLALWFMLDNLTKSSNASFFYNHQNDPGVQQWRAEAERQAKENKELSAKLAALDKSVASMKGQPIDPKALPADIPAEVATGNISVSGSSGNSSSALQQPGKSGKSGGSGLLWVVLILGAGLFLLWLVRRRMADRSTAKEDPVRMGMLGNYVSQKISGKPYEPSLFRVGMTVTVDPTPFLLSAGLTKISVPEGGLTSVPMIGSVSSGKATLHRLYLSEGESFFQLHLDKNGIPEECRYFTVIDEVTPADDGEWGFWLDRAEGMIGWPEFQTKDGKTYQRAWSPGSSRVQPFQMREELKDVRGARTRTFDAMLYAAPTGAAAPAPEQEYILVSAIDDNGQALVQIAAGIDVSPASLSLT